MVRYQLIIFDFDGTLVDTAPDITDCVNAVFRENGFPAQRPEAVKGAIGLGVHQLLARLLGEGRVEGEELDRLVTAFKALYAVNLVKRSLPYPGVPEMLAGPLKGVKKAVVTNKPHDFAAAILRHFGMDRFFERVIGTGIGFPPKPDPEAIRAIMRETGAEAPRTILIGDSGVDRRTAENAGIDFAWVDYGYEAVDRASPFRVFTEARQWACLSNGGPNGPV